MDDDVFGTSIWSTPSYSPAATTAQQSTSAIPPLPPQPSDDFVDSQDQFDDFDNFEAPAEITDGGAVDDEFGDFGDFGDVEIMEEGPTTEGFGFEGAPALAPALPLQLDPMPDKIELRRQVDELLGPVVGPIDWNIVTDEPIREREGPDQVLVTPARLVMTPLMSRIRANVVTISSKEVFRAYIPVSTPQIQPVNWIRSRTRRQHLISLGIPINLDEVLPRTLEKIPALEISTRPSSAPPGPRQSRPDSRVGSRAGSPEKKLQGVVTNGLRLGPKPALDNMIISGLLNLSPGTRCRCAILNVDLNRFSEQLSLSPLATLEGHSANLKLQTSNVSTLLTYLLQTRDALQQDSEMFNKQIGELILEAQKMKTTNKGGQPPRRGTGV